MRFHASYTVSDLELVSSDSVIFRVDTARLSSACPSLSHASSPHLIHAASDTLALFLDSVFGGHPFPESYDVLPSLDALRLLQVHALTACLQRAITELKVRVMDAAACPMQAFVVGAYLRDLDLCRTAIVYGDVPASPTSSHKEEVGHIEDVHAKQVLVVDDDPFYDSDDEYSPPTLAYERGGKGHRIDHKDVMAHLDTIPQEYRSAMTHAWNSSSDPRERGNAFVRLMCLLNEDQSL